jgi:hypothetical protein
MAAIILPKRPWPPQTARTAHGPGAETWSYPEYLLEYRPFGASQCHRGVDWAQLPGRGRQAGQVQTQLRQPASPAGQGIFGPGAIRWDTGDLPARLLSLRAFFERCGGPIPGHSSGYPQPRATSISSFLPSPFGCKVVTKAKKVLQSIIMKRTGGGAYVDNYHVPYGFACYLFQGFLVRVGRLPGTLFFRWPAVGEGRCQRAVPN